MYDREAAPYLTSIHYPTPVGGWCSLCSSLTCSSFSFIVLNVIPQISHVCLDDDVDVDINLARHLNSYSYKRSTPAPST